MRKLTLMFAFLAALSTCTAAIAQSGGNSRPTKLHENVIYGMHGGLALLMDVYLPTDPNGHGVLYIPGCGWHSPSEYDGFSLKDVQSVEHLAALTERGFAVFVMNYRTAPLFRYPAPVEDARRAVRFIRHHGRRFGVTSDRLAAVGHSSGGHLALMLALNPEPGDSEAADAVQCQRAGVEAAVSLAGPTDLTSADWSRWTTGVIASFIGRMPPNSQYELHSAFHREASPITYVDPEDPPIFLIYGTEDDIVPVTQGRALDETLREHDVAVRFFEVAGAGHGIADLLGAADQARGSSSMETIADWLLSQIEGADREESK